MFFIGKIAIGYYLQNNTSVTAYGAASSLVILLLWVYYTSLILYFGAEFTQAYVRYEGRKIAPNQYAIWVEKNIVPKKYNTDIHESKPKWLYELP